MTTAPTEVVQVLGRVRAGDAVTATARALRSRWTRLGQSARIVDTEPGVATTLPDLGDATVVVHTVDGGEALAEATGALAGRPLTIVHHGSAIGSDRSTLRALRPNTVRAVAADAGAREELRALGYRCVGLLDPAAAIGAFDDVTPAAATAANLASHPGPFVLCIGPLVVERGLAALIDGFAALTTRAHPSAVLSLCGPSDPWYRAGLAHHVATRGLQACEVVEPADEGEVLARIERADVIVALHPAGLDPYLCEAVGRGLPVIAPHTARTAAIDPVNHVTPVTCGSAGLADALADALDRAGSPRERPPTSDAAALDRAVLGALGLT